MEGFKSIYVREETHAALGKMGIFRETYDDIIVRMIACCKKKEKTE